jgi:hypothetical protein
MAGFYSRPGFPLKRMSFIFADAFFFSFFSYRGIDVSRDVQPGMPEKFLHRLHLFAGFQKQRGEGMAQVVKAGLRYACFF